MSGGDRRSSNVSGRKGVTIMCVISPQRIKEDRSTKCRERNMLVLSRKTSERILIGDEIAITIVRIGPNSVRIGIEAPRDMNIVREELCDFSSKSKDEATTNIAVPVN
jgi:carbon storage regulator